jgi:hypothetical protein
MGMGLMHAELVVAAGLFLLVVALAAISDR